MKNILLFSLLLCLFWSCNKPKAPDCFQVAGDQSTEWRTLPDFDQIEIRDNMDVYLVDSDEEKIKVEGPYNLLPEIKTEVENNVLKITNENTCNFVRSYKHNYVVTLYSKNFKYIQNHGTGELKSSNTLHGHYLFLENKRSMGKVELAVEMDSLRILNTAGYSDITVSGSVENLYLFHQGLGIMNATGMSSQRAFVNNNSINDIYVRFSDYMYAAINERGNIYYRGSSALIDADHFGSGSLIAQ